MDPKVNEALLRLGRAVNMLADDVWNHVHAPDGEMVVRYPQDTEYVDLKGLVDEDEIDEAIGGTDPE